MQRELPESWVLQKNRTKRVLFKLDCKVMKSRKALESASEWLLAKKLRQLSRFQMKRKFVLFSVKL